jgi:hypothetical protein
LGIVPRPYGREFDRQRGEYKLEVGQVAPLNAKQIGGDGLLSEYGIGIVNMEESIVLKLLGQRSMEKLIG